MNFIAIRMMDGRSSLIVDCSESAYSAGIVGILIISYALKTALWEVVWA